LIIVVCIITRRSLVKLSMGSHNCTHKSLFVLVGVRTSILGKRILEHPHTLFLVVHIVVFLPQMRLRPLSLKRALYHHANALANAPCCSAYLRSKRIE
jgi:hypothetical protein